MAGRTAWEKANATRMSLPAPIRCTRREVDTPRQDSFHTVPRNPFIPSPLSAGEDGVNGINGMNGINEMNIAA
jgi:hypothetical protein